MAEQSFLPGFGGETYLWPASRVIETFDRWNPTLHYRLVQDESTLDHMIASLRALDTWAWDTETSGLKPELGARICGHAFAARTGERELTGWYVPIRHIGPMNEHDTQLDPVVVSERLKPLFLHRGNGEVLVTHGKFDKKMARADGIELTRASADCAIAATIHDENEPRFGLKFLAEKYMTPLAKGEEEGLKAWMRTDARSLGLSFDKHSPAAIKKLGGVLNAMVTPTYKQRFGYSRTPLRLCGTYAIHDVAYTWWLLMVRYAKTRRDFPEVWEREHAIAEYLFEMEWRGLPADESVIRDTHERTKLAVAYWLSECRRLAPDYVDESFEAGDTELRALFYEKLKLTPPKYTDGEKPSVDKEARKLLELQHPEHRPLLRAIGQLASVIKLHTTYAGGYLRFYSPTTKSIHPSYNQLEQRKEGGVPVTGRLSSSDPNGQNVASRPLHLWDCFCPACLKEAAKEAAETGEAPAKDEDRLRGRQMRGLPVENTVSVRRYFIVLPGWVRVYIDFSQIELRMLTWFSQDEALIRAYQEDADIHQIVCDQLQITRKTAKEVNFLTVYGGTEKALMLRMPAYYKDPEKTEKEAIETLERYHRQYPGIRGFRTKFATQMKRNGLMFVSPFGRPRRIPDIAAPESWKRESAERKMMSSIISGTAADLMKESMRRTAPIAQSFGGHLVQTIHDELVYDLPRRPGWAQTMMSMVRRMEDWPQFSESRGGRLGVPIKTNVALTTQSWEHKVEIKHYPDGTFTVPTIG